MSASRLTATAPVLLVRDVVASAAYYRDKLGFSYDGFAGEPANFVILTRDGQRVMLSQAPPDYLVVPHWKTVPNMWNVYFWVDDVETLYRELVERGANIDYGLADRVYGCREFGTQDLDGHDIGFGQLIR